MFMNATGVLKLIAGLRFLKLQSRTKKSSGFEIADKTLSPLLSPLPGKFVFPAFPIPFGIPCDNGYKTLFEILTANPHAAVGILACGP
jgi:hypothetical protein